MSRSKIDVGVPRVRYHAGRSERRGRGDTERLYDGAAEVTFDSIASRRVITGETPATNVLYYGVVGDGETDDSAAFQEAVDAATPHGVLYVPPAVELYFEEPIDIDLSESGQDQNRFAFVCEGWLHPAPGTGDRVRIHHGKYTYVNVRIEGGGQDPDTDNAIHIAGITGGYYEGVAAQYGGTVFKIDSGPQMHRGLG